MFGGKDQINRKVYHFHRRYSEPPSHFFSWESHIDPAVSVLLSVQVGERVSLMVKTHISTAHHLKAFWAMAKSNVRPADEKHPFLRRVCPADLCLTILIRANIKRCRWINTLSGGDRGEEIKTWPRLRTSQINREQMKSRSEGDGESVRRGQRRRHRQLRLHARFPISHWSPWQSLEPAD